MLTPHPEEHKLQQLRTNIAIIWVAALCFLLLSRLWYLQVVSGAELLKQSESNRTRLLSVRAPRGTILDRKSRTIASSRAQFVVLATPDILVKTPEAMSTLCGILQITKANMLSLIDKGDSRPGSPMRVAVDVGLDKVAMIGELRTRLPGVSVELDHIRQYGMSSSVCHVVGYLGKINQDEIDAAEKRDIDYGANDYVGKAGLEKQYETELRGTDGGKQIEVNAMGRAVRVLGEKPSLPGQTLKLTIDSDLQAAAYKAMGKQVGGVAAIDPRTGAVLTMVSTPGFDPNLFVKSVDPEAWHNIMSNKNHPMQNRALTNAYPPGSVFKPMVATAGLKYGACTEYTTAYCSGVKQLGNRKFKCWAVHRNVNFIKALSESCDVWFYEMSLRLHIDRMAYIVKQFGIGQETGVDLPSESRHKSGTLGAMPDPEWKEKRFKESWYPGDTLNTSIGQGYVLVTPLQMAVSTAAISNDGKVYKPYVVDEILNTRGIIVHKTHPKLVRTVEADPQAFALVRQGMRAAVVSGTGRVVNINDIAVAGKTGTAQNPPHAAHGWFICFAPLENPQIAIACVVEQGKHGASTAAPVCRAILDVYFGKLKAAQVKNGVARVKGD